MVEFWACSDPRWRYFYLPDEKGGNADVAIAPILCYKVVTLLQIKGQMVFPSLHNVTAGFLSARFGIYFEDEKLKYSPKGLKREWKYDDI